ncbi:MAG TPA: hypothetical protein VM820_09265 [Vicinamibacterales bacterium]|nr:hypothetical protein [Vicinamibacterales bacterium]
MSTRLQVVIPEALDRRIRKAALRRRQSKGGWVREALARALAEPAGAADPLSRLSGARRAHRRNRSDAGRNRGGTRLMVFVDSIAATGPPHLRLALQTVRGTPHAQPPTIQHVPIDHRRAHVSVSGQFLGADIVAVLEQVRRERVAQGVAAGPLGDAGSVHGLGDGTLDDGLVQMEAAGRAPARIAAERAAGKANCQGQDRPAFGYFTSSPSGSATRPSPHPRSASYWRFTVSRWARRSVVSVEGSGVLRSLAALP